MAKRRQIVQCIQNGFRAVHAEARWLITSRVIGYDDAPVNKIDLAEGLHSGIFKFHTARAKSFEPVSAAEFLAKAKAWFPYITERYWSSRLQIIVDREVPTADFFDVVAAYEELLVLPIAQCIYPAPFDDERQDLFTRRWFQHRHGTDHSRELMREVRGHHHDGVRIISRVPNLLCLMNILKRSGKPLPDGRAALYDEIVKAYLGGIDASYRLRPIHGNSCPFDPAQRRFLLCLLGAHMQLVRLAKDDDEADGNLLMSRAEIAEVLGPVIEGILRDGRVVIEHSAEELLEELLRHIASRSGLLIPRSTDAKGQTLFGFSHLSFLEFFAAEWLGREFDRQRNRIVRRSEAASDGQELSEEELDQEFPREGPVEHLRRDFEHLPAHPAWHEPLIFLVESRRADAAMLLRWLFPALCSDKPLILSERDETSPLLRLEAVRLAVKLAHDTEVLLSPETRCHWWQRLWGAYLEWDDSHAWNVGRVLLEREELRAEVLEALAAELPRHPGRPLELFDCDPLTSADVHMRSGLESVRELGLWFCGRWQDIDALAGLRHLEKLTLFACNGLEDDRAFQGLAGLKSLRKLRLEHCCGFQDTAVLRGLRQLEELHLSGCEGLGEAGALRGLAGLDRLNLLNLEGCIGLDAAAVRAVRGFIRVECWVKGPDGEWVGF